MNNVRHLPQASIFHSPTSLRGSERLLYFALILAFTYPQSIFAAPVDLAKAPMLKASSTSVLPNLMFIMDNSGSMGQDYTPDYMSTYNVSTASSTNPWTDSSWSPASDEKVCKDSGDDNSSDGVVSNAITTSSNPLDLCVIGDVPYMTSALNTQYYNPAILYLPGVKADGSSNPSQTDPSSVLTDGYNKQKRDQLYGSFTSVDLTTQYPDRVWCTKNDPKSSDLINNEICRKNSDYLYPNETYKYGRTTPGNSSDVLGVYGAPYYYDVVVSEYCKSANLKECTSSSVPTGAYVFPAKSRWCSDPTLTTCQATKTSTYQYPRYVGSSVTAVAATGYMKVGGTSKNKCFSSITVNGVEILGATICWGNSENDAGFASLLKDQINIYSSNPEYTAAINGGTNTQIDLTSTLAAGATGNGNVEYVSTGTSLTMKSGTDISGGVTGLGIAPYTFVRTDIVPEVTSYPAAPGRTDCSGSCTYNQEITNFGNWYAYYRTRLQSMKSSASLAFKSIDNRYRVGYYTLSTTSNYLPIAKFDNVASGSEAVNQKATWYSRLFNTVLSGSTPLRSALSTIGRLYAGQKPIGTSDPMQYSCQQNFALLTTDGYWNSDSDSDVKNLGGSAVGDLDGGATPRPMYEGPNEYSNTLADAAKYYYDTDLRTVALGNCTGSKGLNVCTDNVFTSSTDLNVKQHMTTFTLGLGVDGTVTYSSDYKTAEALDTAPVDARLDYYNIVKGAGDWPKPVQNTETAVDDLWHAAVNGQGQYFSAKNPKELTDGLNSALASIAAKYGSGSAAATSSLAPVAGNNFSYVASYTTGNWTGNLEARKINVDTGVVSEAATWCVENTIAGTCSLPDVLTPASAGGSTVYNCVKSSVLSASDCSSVYDSSALTCSTEMPIACTGRMTASGVVAPSSDGRTIYTNLRGALVPFVYANLNPAHFTATGLSQWSTLTAAQQVLAAGENLVNYLRGQTAFDSRAGNSVDNRLYRYRSAVMGDSVESEPAFIGPATFKYSDAGYSAFIIAQKSRSGTVYIGSNDGMLHAFNAETGDERWAYVPSMVVPNMWKLADKNYASMHNYYVNGSPIISDVYVDGAWKTILVGGLNAGGRGYYALDITNPTSPSLLWEFDTTSDSNLGYSFGKPVITKLADGTWVVLVTSGYNNTSPGDGGGYLYVLNAKNGAKIRTYSTGVTGSSGFAQIATWVDTAEVNNSAQYTYGGDLLGNLWRFDINKSSGAVVKFAELKDSSNNPQPITTRPVFGNIVGKHVVFIGTGKYLEELDITDTQQQTLYAIKDSDAYPTTSPSATLVNPRNSLVKSTFTTTDATRKSDTERDINWSIDRGYYADLPDSGERVNLDGKLILGTWLVPTLVPQADETECSSSGYGWLNYLDYKTGKSRTNSAGELSGVKMNAAIVGLNILYLPNGKVVVSVVTADHPTPDIISGVGVDSLTGAFMKKRVIWRELIPDAVTP